jgi:formate C-acetyltransferase
MTVPVLQSIPRGSTPRTRRLAREALAAAAGPFTEFHRLQQDGEALAAATLPTVLREATAFAHVFTHLTPVIRPNELLVGALQRAATPEGQYGWSPDGGVGYVEWFAGHVPEEWPDIRADAARGLLSPQGSLNHKVVDYANVIRIGTAALARRARQLADEWEGPRRDLALACAMGYEAMIAHAHHYAHACRERALTSDDAGAAELREIARICEKVPAQPAETFREALQSLWFAYLAAGDATGRLDVYLHEFYQADLAAGRITPAAAQELLECLLIKLHADTFSDGVNVSSVQTMTLGGALPDGRDACNALTRLTLRAAHAVRLLRPTIYIRCTPDTPADVLEEALAMLGDGLAEPSFYGDAPILAGLARIGVPAEIARDYALSGCTEVVSPGRGNWGAPNGWVNFALAVDDVLRTDPPDEDALWVALARKLDDLAEQCRRCNIAVDERVTDARFSATLLMPCCLEHGADLLHGGAESHYGHWEGIGLPNAADMLHAALELGLRRGVPMSGLYAQLDAGDPGLRAAIRALPKFGNDMPAVDDLAARLVTLMADALERRSTPLRKALVLGHLAGGENMHIAYGHFMGATLDGRAAGQPLADSLAAAQGVAATGPTALINSLCRLDHSRLIAGNVSTLRVSPTDLATPDGRRTVAALVRAFVANGGSQLQLNVADADTLRAAQAHPERYPDLLVRVAGYSSAFVTLGKPLQDEIIARTEGFMD